MKTRVHIIISSKRVAWWSASLMQVGAHTGKRNAAWEGLCSCPPGPCLPFGFGFYIHPSTFLRSLSRNEAPIFMRPRFLSVTKMWLIWKKSSQMTCLIASSWLGRNLKPQNPLFDPLHGFVKTTRSPKQKFSFVIFFSKPHWMLSPVMPHGPIPSCISLQLAQDHRPPQTLPRSLRDTFTLPDPANGQI